MKTPMRPMMSMLVGAAVLLLAACASGPRITAEADPRVDFSGYRTYAFHSPLAIEPDGYETPLSEAAKTTVARELEARGYVFDAEDPDLRVNINGYLERRTDVSATPTVDYAFYYGYRSYYAVPYWNTRPQVTSYTEGTINIDLVDSAQNRLVWEGLAVGRVPSSLDTAQKRERLVSAIHDIFARYPHRAGQVTPAR